jgi:repressor LexA
MKSILSKKEAELLKQIRNWFQHKGYTPSVRDLRDALGYKSPRSITILLQRLKDKGIIFRDDNNELKINEGFKGDTTKVSTIDVPVVGMVACGAPILAQENIKTMIAIDTSIARPPHRYFILEAKGDSMNKKGIKDGDLVLIRQQQTAKEKDIVVALINDEATIKEFHRSGNFVVLKPHSTNPKHEPIILTENLMIQGVVVTVIPKVR